MRRTLAAKGRSSCRSPATRAGVVLTAGLAVFCVAVGLGVVRYLFFGSVAHRAMSATTEAERDHRLRVLEIVSQTLRAGPVTIQLPGRKVDSVQGLAEPDPGNDL